MLSLRVGYCILVGELALCGVLVYLINFTTHPICLHFHALHAANNHRECFNQIAAIKGAKHGLLEYYSENEKGEQIKSYEHLAAPVTKACYPKEKLLRGHMQSELLPPMVSIGSCLGLILLRLGLHFLTSNKKLHVFVAVVALALYLYIAYKIPRVESNFPEHLETLSGRAPLKEASLKYDENWSMAKWLALLMPVINLLQTVISSLKSDAAITISSPKVVLCDCSKKYETINQGQAAESGSKSGEHANPSEETA